MTNNSFLAPVKAGLDDAKALRWLMGSAIGLLWCYIMLPELTGLAQLLQTLSLFNVVLLVGAAVVLLVQSLRHWQDWGVSAQPTFRVLPLLVMFGAAIAAILARWWLDLEQLSVIAVVVGAYGVVGLFCHARPWRRGIPFMGAFAALMLLLLLEFTDLGHLARTGIAEVVAQLLKPYSVDAISSEDILILSTGVAFVDIPCSGFKGIEIGSLLFVAASLLERKQLGMRWLLVGLANVTLLIAANITRILVLVVLTFMAQQPTLAEALHVPLGLCGFVTTGIITLYLLQLVPRQSSILRRNQLIPQPDQPTQPIEPTIVTLRKAALALGLLVALACVPPSPAIATPAISVDGLQWPASLQTQRIDLTQYEQTFFTRYPGVVTQKQAFRFNEVSGSMIVVVSPTWQAHHAPELCFVASGLQIDRMEKAALTRQVTGRWLSLNQGQRQAAYWFQSSEQTTDYYLDRVWREITRRDPQWTMVSILFDQPVSAGDRDVEMILDAVHSAIAQAMA